MSKVKDAVSAFESGFNCSQAIVRTYGPDYGLSALDAIRVSCGFGGGMRRADTCGAVTGALMVLGLRFGAAAVRALETGVTIRVLRAAHRSVEVNRPEDVPRVEALLRESVRC